jgi:hypothetical protein
LARLAPFPRKEVAEYPHGKGNFYYVILLFLIIFILITKCSHPYIFRLTCWKRGLKNCETTLIWIPRTTNP